MYDSDLKSALPNSSTRYFYDKQYYMFKNPFSFSGRIRRMEYGLTFIIYIVAYVEEEHIITYCAFIIY